jgi:hypothetical protein
MSTSRAQSVSGKRLNLSQLTNSVLIGVPLLAWLLHIVWLVPALDAETGDYKFIAAIRFFMVFGLVMCVCEAVTLGRLVRAWSWPLIVAVILNLTPLYYLKVILWGPTIGNL